MRQKQNAKLVAQQQINKALNIWRCENYITPPETTIDLMSYDLLSRLQIDQGVVALVLACNLSGGSVGDVDLYKLIRTYLQCPDAREAINRIMDA